MANMKRMVGKSKLTGADITGQKYDTKIKEEAAKIRLKVRMKEKLTRYEKSVLDSDAAIKRMNTKPAAKTTTKAPAQKRPGLKPATKGPAAIKAIQDRVSPAGVKKAEAGAKKAIDKKYPGLYKKSK